MKEEGPVDSNSRVKAGDQRTVVRHPCWKRVVLCSRGGDKESEAKSSSLWRSPGPQCYSRTVGEGRGTGVEAAIRGGGGPGPRCPHSSCAPARPWPPGGPTRPMLSLHQVRIQEGVALVLVRGRKVDCEKRDRVKRSSEASSGGDLLSWTSILPPTLTQKTRF